jgi:hypothetical protein
MVFEGLDGMFCSIGVILIWRYKLPLDIFLTKVFSYGGRGFIVEDIEFGLETFAG